MCYIGCEFSLVMNVYVTYSVYKIFTQDYWELIACTFWACKLYYFVVSINSS